MLGKQDGQHEDQRCGSPSLLDKVSARVAWLSRHVPAAPGVCRQVPGLTVLVVSCLLSYTGLFCCSTYVSSSCLLWDQGCVQRRHLPAVSSSHGRLYPGALLRVLPVCLLQQWIYSVQTPVVLFWFLVITAQKLGLAIPKYRILGLKEEGELLTTGEKIPYSFQPL